MRHQRKHHPQQGWFRRQLAHSEDRKSWNRVMYQAALLAPYLDQDAVVLDIGCGNGALASRMRQLTGCTVVGVDVADTQTVDLDFLVFDGARLPCSSVDYVVFSFVLHHSRAPLTLCSEALRVARHGIFVFEDMPATLFQRMLLAVHIVLFAWLYGIQWPETVPWKGSYVDALTLLQSSTRAHVVDLPRSRFKVLYPVSRRFYAFLLPLAKPFT